jgi:hypothetical protein
LTILALFSADERRQISRQKAEKIGKACPVPCRGRAEGIKQNQRQMRQTQINLKTFLCSLQRFCRWQKAAPVTDDTNADKFKNLALLPAEVLQKAESKKSRQSR